MTTPGAPTLNFVTPGNTSAQISFTAPSNTGSSPIISYEYLLNNGSDWLTINTQTASPFTITDLSNGITYNIKLRARNASGTGTESDSLGVSVLPSSTNTFTWVPSTGQSSSWKSIAYGDISGGLYVALASVANGTNNVMTSTDGINWTLRSSGTGTLSGTWQSVTFGNNLFVAVASVTGGTNCVMTSPDGTNWTSRTGFTGTWQSVTYGGGYFVAIAANLTTGANIVMTSPNGIDWTVQTATLGLWKSVTYGNGRFVAVTDNAITSSGGPYFAMTFTIDTNGTFTSSLLKALGGSWKSVTYGNGAYVAVGTNCAMTFTSNSFGSFTFPIAVTTITGTWQSVTYGNGWYVIVSTTGGVRTSSDGATWSSPQTISGTSLQSMIYGNRRFVGVSNSGSNRIITYMFTSTSSAPTITSVTPLDGSVSVAFTAGSTSGTNTSSSNITNYKYSTDNGSTWTTISPSITTSPITITGLTNGSTYNIRLLAINGVGDGTPSVAILGSPSCFNEGTKILCLNKNLEEEYIPIENLRKGDLVKSYKHGYRKIDLIGKNYMLNNPEIFYTCMYKMKKTETNGLLEDLIVTGWHAILVDDLGINKEENEKIINGGLLKVDDKYLLLSSVSKDFVKLENNNLYTYYHFILESEDDNQRFGVWANGILTELPSKNLFIRHNYILL